MPNSEDQVDQSVSPINQEIIDDLYDKYCADPLSVPEDWREYFSALEARNEQIKEAEPHEKQPVPICRPPLQWQPPSLPPPMSPGKLPSI